MNPVATDVTAAAILEGCRRAFSERTALAAGRADAELTLTELVERATAHAEGLGTRLPGIGERLDRIT